jgi:hypothetical protein
LTSNLNRSIQAGYLEIWEIIIKFSFSGCLSEPNDDCQVIEMATNTTKKCFFPFGEHEGDINNGCIADDKPDFIGKFWCSTKVDSDNIHISGYDYWGHCGQNCSIEENAEGWFPKL